MKDEKGRNEFYKLQDKVLDTNEGESTYYEILGKNKCNMKRVQLIDLTPEQLTEIFDSTFAKRIEILKKELLHENANDELLSREQAAELLHINLSTIWHWQKKGKIKCYGISGARRYYKRSELMNALKQLQK